MLKKSLYCEAGFWQVEDRFLAGTRNEIHFGKRSHRSQVEDLVAGIQLVRVEIRTERACAAPHSVDIRRKTDHFTSCIIGELIAKYGVFGLKFGWHGEFLGLFIYMTNNLSTGTACNQQKQKK